MKKLFSILLVACIIFGVFYIFQRNFLDHNDQTETTVDDNSIISIQILDETPPTFKEIVEEISQENNWDITQNNPDILVGFDIQEEKYTSVYQFFVVTKPWKQLASTDSTVITNISDSIDEVTFREIEQDYFSYDKKSESDYLLQSFSELDGTRLTVNIENISIFDSSWWNNKNYPLALEIKIAGNERVDDFTKALEQNEKFRSLGYTFEYPKPNDFVEIIKTGTAVAGGPGWELCERVKGSQTYPIDNVKDILKKADLAIISNESSFVDGCSQGAGTTAFCGKPKYIQNLLDMGIDIISLTGNHMNDYGRDYFTDTLKIYEKNEIQYFASGNNSEEAWTPLIYETNAGKIAFIGVNRMGPDGVIATDVLTGTAYYDQEIFLEKLDEVADDVDIVWLDTHLWPEYGTTPSQEQITISQLAIDNGVDIVTGVSSHEPQGIAFYNDKPVFYGLGNFLFDQMWSAETRLGMVLKVYIYNGKIVNIDILPTQMYDYCQPRFLEGTDKTSVLEYFVGISE